MSVRESFVEIFGKEQAHRIELAANEHSNDVNSTSKGADPFKWAVLVCIGYECVSRPSFAQYHQITIGQDKFKEWCLEHGELGTHDGDSDYLALFCGTYEPYLKPTVPLGKSEARTEVG